MLVHCFYSRIVLLSRFGAVEDDMIDVPAFPPGKRSMRRPVSAHFGGWVGLVLRGNVSGSIYGGIATYLVSLMSAKSSLRRMSYEACSRAALSGYQPPDWAQELAHPPQHRLNASAFSTLIQRAANNYSLVPSPLRCDTNFFLSWRSFPLLFIAGTSQEFPRAFTSLSRGTT